MSKASKSSVYSSLIYNFPSSKLFIEMKRLCFSKSSASKEANRGWTAMKEKKKTRKEGREGGRERGLIPLGWQLNDLFHWGEEKIQRCVLERKEGGSLFRGEMTVAMRHKALPKGNSLLLLPSLWAAPGLLIDSLQKLSTRHLSRKFESLIYSHGGSNEEILEQRKTSRWSWWHAKSSHHAMTH